MNYLFGSVNKFIKYAFKSISVLKCGDLIIDNQEGIEQHFLYYYSNILASNIIMWLMI